MVIFQKSFHICVTLVLCMVSDIVLVMASKTLCTISLDFFPGKLAFSLGADVSPPKMTLPAHFLALYHIFRMISAQETVFEIPLFCFCNSKHEPVFQVWAYVGMVSLIPILSCNPS